ncbi:MAG: class I SAM-dependent rRNA methyltransferase [Pseudomonadota bacterium]
MSDMPRLKFRPNKSPQRLQRGFPWAYADELVLDRRAKKIAPGTIGVLCDAQGQEICLAAFNPQSKITARVLDTDIHKSIDAAWFAEKLTHAAALRDRLYQAPFYRLIHAEADGLPGVIIDRFGDVFSVQPNAAWAEIHFDALKEALITCFNPTAIYKNAASRGRALEGLDDNSMVVLGEITAPIPVQMNGATYLADLIEGQKTGLFYDQRDNHAFAARLAKGGSVLDVFSHVGGFGLAAAAQGASAVTFVDSSAAALDLIARAGPENRFTGALNTLRGDAFDVMTKLSEDAKRFDLVVCDPPAFAPNKQALDAGLRAYTRAAKLAADLVTTGGYLALCSCSHAATVEKFRTACLTGIGKAGRRGQILHTGGAGADHPMHPALSESGYLKSLFLRLG